MPVEEGTRVLVPRFDDVGDTFEAAVFVTKLASRANRVREHRIAIELGREASECTCPLASHRDQAGLSKQLEVLGHVWLRLPGQLGKLPDRELFLGGQPEQAKPPRLPE
jgi:hypothetical protein